MTEPEDPSTALEAAAPQVVAAAEKLGFGELLHSVASPLSDRLLMRRQLRLAALTVATAETASARGLPVYAIRDPFLRAAMEHGSLVDDLELRGRWVNLLVSAATSPDSTHVSLPVILSQMEPHDARLLERIANETPAGAEHLDGHYVHIAGEGNRPSPADRLAIDNLTRLRLIVLPHTNFPGHTAEDETIVILTVLGRTFHDACNSTGANAG